MVARARELRSDVLPHNSSRGGRLGPPWQASAGRGALVSCLASFCTYPNTLPRATRGQGKALRPSQRRAIGCFRQVPAESVAQWIDAGSVKTSDKADANAVDVMFHFILCSTLLFTAQSSFYEGGWRWCAHPWLIAGVCNTSTCTSTCISSLLLILALLCIPSPPLFLQFLVISSCQPNLRHQEPSSNERKRIQRRSHNKNDPKPILIGRCKCQSNHFSALIACRCSKPVRRVEQ